MRREGLRLEVGLKGDRLGRIGGTGFWIVGGAGVVRVLELGGTKFTGFDVFMVEGDSGKGVEMEEGGEEKGAGLAEVEGEIGTFVVDGLVELFKLKKLGS